MIEKALKVALEQSRDRLSVIRAEDVFGKAKGDEVFTNLVPGGMVREGIKTVLERFGR